METGYIIVYERLGEDGEYHLNTMSSHERSNFASPERAAEVFKGLILGKDFKNPPNVFLRSFDAALQQIVVESVYPEIHIIPCKTVQL